MEENLLKKEIETYNKHKEKLLKENNGKFVLIKEEEIIGVYESQKDALNICIGKFGNVPFLVKKIEEIEEKQNFTSNLINISKIKRVGELGCRH